MARGHVIGRVSGCVSLHGQRHVSGRGPKTQVALKVATTKRIDILDKNLPSWAVSLGVAAGHVNGRGLWELADSKKGKNIYV